MEGEDRPERESRDGERYVGGRRGHGRCVDAGAVEFVAARRGPGGRLLQEWRFRSTGRVLEVADADAYARSDRLEPGASGHVRYEGGVPGVVRRPGDTLVGRAAARHGPRGAGGDRGGASRPRAPVEGRPGGASGGWWLVILLVLVVVLVLTR